MSIIFLSKNFEEFSVFIMQKKERKEEEKGRKENA